MASSHRPPGGPHYGVRRTSTGTRYKVRTDPFQPHQHGHLVPVQGYAARTYTPSQQLQATLGFLSRHEAHLSPDGRSPDHQASPDAILASLREHEYRAAMAYKTLR